MVEWIPADAKIAAAVVAAAASLVVALIALLGTTLAALLAAQIGRRTQIAVEDLRADRQDRNAGRNAARDYEYAARKRLYNECEPAIFQFLEEAKSAQARIETLARLAELGTLDDVWLKNKENRLSTLYRLLSPLAAFTLLRERLTLFDLSLEPRIYLQYSIGRLLLNSFCDDDALARLGSALPYKPLGKPPAGTAADPAIYAQQGIDAALLDRFLSALIEPWCESGPRAVISYARFQHLAHDKVEPLNDLCLLVDDLLRSMEPSRKPVLWRVLSLQYLLYGALLKTASLRAAPACAEAVMLWIERERATETRLLDACAHPRTVDAALEFLRPRFARLTEFVLSLSPEAMPHRRLDDAREGVS